MVILHFWPAPCLWAAAMLLAWLSRRGKHADWTAFGSILCASGLILLILVAGGALQEGLACLLPVLFLMLPKETRHEL